MTEVVANNPGISTVRRDEEDWLNSSYQKGMMQRNQNFMSPGAGNF